MSPGEDEITAWFASRSKLSKVDFPIGIGDDMAEVRVEGKSILITTDMLLDGVHFDLKKATLEQVGYKAMAVSLSDCAAMATVPVAAVVCVALPKEYGERELKQLHKGIRAAGDKYGCALVGGDITRWKGDEPFAIAVAMLSKRAGNKPVRRSGAKVGDAICVTGELGGSGIGRHLIFEPRVKEALEIAGMVKLNAMMDISDGLSSDLKRICEQSKVGALIEAELIPISQAAKESNNPLDSALNEGEDFELLFTVSKSQYKQLVKKWRRFLAITKIGMITNTNKMQLKMPDGKIVELQPAGYDHLRE
jgi:thiamine-monophosphate kinase